MLVLSLDVGTSSARARLYDGAGAAVPGLEGRVAYEPVTTADGGVELDAEALLGACARAVDDALARAGARSGHIAAVGVSAFWHGLLGLDGAGRPLTAVLTWADTRAAEAVEELAGLVDGAAVHARTGAPLHASYFPAKLRWLRRSHPATFARARTWCGFPEYLLRRVTGVRRTSVSLASGTGLLDQERLDWDPAMLALAEVPSHHLPDISDEPVTGLAPEFARRWPTLTRVPWFPGWGDGACSNIGSGCVDPGRVAVNIGTSAALRVVLARTPPPPPGLWRYRVDAARFLVGGATSEGGNVVAWCRETFGLPGADAALDALLAAIPVDGHGLTCLPFLAGERSPGWRADARGALHGLTLGTTAAHVLRAFLEAVTLRLALIYERLAPVAAPGHEVVVSGGALAHSVVWAGLLADALGVPIALSAEAEASGRGAALLALAALGAPPAPAPARGRVVDPDPARHAVLRAARARQQLLYDSVVRPRLS